MFPKTIPILKKLKKLLICSQIFYSLFKFLIKILIKSRKEVGISYSIPWQVQNGENFAGWKLYFIFWIISYYKIFC